MQHKAMHFIPPPQDYNTLENCRGPLFIDIALGVWLAQLGLLCSAETYLCNDILSSNRETEMDPGTHHQEQQEPESLQEAEPLVETNICILPLEILEEIVKIATTPETFDTIYEVFQFAPGMGYFLAKLKHNMFMCLTGSEREHLWSKRRRGDVGTNHFGVWTRKITNLVVREEITRHAEKKGFPMAGELEFIIHPGGHLELKRGNNTHHPRTARDLSAFLGIASYYRRFIPDFSRAARALVHLTSWEVAYTWTPECQDAYQTLTFQMENIHNPMYLVWGNPPNRDTGETV